jgi:hypothetical protein
MTAIERPANALQESYAWSVNAAIAADREALACELAAEFTTASHDVEPTAEREKARVA